MNPRRFLLTAVFFWCAAIVATPLLDSLGGAGTSTASFSYHFFSRVCHQIDSRSFHIAGGKFAVCIRCFSIYAAFFLSVLFYPLLSRTRVSAVSSRALLALSALPMAIDVALDGVGVCESTGVSRAVTGVVFGFALGIVLAPLLEELVREIFSRLNHFLRTTYATKTR
jgi:uncharacterized membrane protein